MRQLFQSSRLSLRFIAMAFAILLIMPSFAQERKFGRDNNSKQGDSRSKDKKNDAPPPHHDNGRPPMSGDMLVIRTRKAGEVKNMISPEARKQVRRLVVEGSINRDDLRFIDDICDRSSCYNIKGKSIENFLDLDLSRAQIVSPYRDVLPSDIFSNNSRLRSIQLPMHLIEIGKRAFSYCSILERVDMPSGIRLIDDYAFRNCKMLTDIRLPDRLEDIGKGSFTGCTALSRIILPPGLRSIGSEAFVNCPISQIRFPYQLEYIGNNCFAGTRISEINIPRNTRVDGMPGNNANLQAINVEQGNISLSSIDGILYDSRGTTLLMVPGGASGYLSIPHNVTAIGARALEYSRLSQVDIPPSVVSIGEGAFYGCVNLTNIEIPNGVTQIAANTFNSCKNLQRVVLPRGIISIGANAFCECRKLYDFVLPIGLQSLGKSSFLECNAITRLVVPSGVTEIPDGCFRNCNGMVSIKLSNGIIKIGEEAFRGCLSLTDIMLPNTLQRIDDEAFRSCSSLGEIVIPESVSSMGSKPFTKCEQLGRIICRSHVPPSVKSTGCEKTILVVPRGSYNVYKKSTGWKKHKQIVEE